MIGFCGLICHECPAFIATEEDDDNKRKEIAEEWSRQFNTSVKPEDINCEGCVSNSKVLFSYPRVCKIRKCGRKKGVMNCGYCDEYVCYRLNKFFENVPDAKVILDSMPRYSEESFYK